MEPVCILPVTLGLSSPFLPSSIPVFNIPGFLSHSLLAYPQFYPSTQFFFRHLSCLLLWTPAASIPDQSLPSHPAPTCRLTALCLLPPSLPPSSSFPFNLQVLPPWSNGTNFFNFWDPTYKFCNYPITCPILNGSTLIALLWQSQAGFFVSPFTPVSPDSSSEFFAGLFPFCS